MTWHLTVRCHVMDCSNGSDFRCYNIYEEFDELLNLSDIDKRKSSIKKRFWLAHTLECHKEVTSFVVDVHNQSGRLLRSQSTVPNNSASDGRRIVLASLAPTDQSPRSALNPPRGNPTPFPSHGSVNEERPLTEGIHDIHTATPLAHHSQAPIY